MEGALVIDFELTKEAVKALGTTLWLRTKGIYLTPIPLLALFAWRASPSNPIGLVLTMAAIGLAAGAVLGLLRWRHNMRVIFAPFEGKHVHLELTADGVNWRVGDTVHTSDWSRVAEARKLGEFVLLVMPKETPSCLPIPLDADGRTRVADFLSRAKIVVR